MSPAPEFPSLLGCLRIGPAALARVLRAPRVLLLISGTMIAIGLLTVLPIYQRLGELLHHTPGAQGRFGRVLLDDLARLHPETQLGVGGTGLLAMFLWMFFAGGVLAHVGLVGNRRASIADFLAACGRFFFRSLRSWLVFVLTLLLWSWVTVGLLQPLLEPMFVTGGSEIGMYRFEVAVNVVWLLGFGLLLMLRRIALARLVLLERSSVLVAYSAALGVVLRQPLKVIVACLGMFVVWGVGLAVCALALDRFLGDDRLLPALLVTVVAMIWFQCGILGSWLLARRLTVLHGLSGAPAVVLDSEAPADKSAFVEVARTVH